MVAAAGLTTRWNPSRKRVAIVNMSAVAGAALGIGTAFMAGEYGGLDYTFYPMVVLGAAIWGAGVGGYLSGRTEGGRSAMGSLLGTHGEHLSLGVPLPTVIQGPSGSRGIGLSLANGRF